MRYFVEEIAAPGAAPRAATVKLNSYEGSAAGAATRAKLL